jgi:hypothetical protein
MRNHKCTNDHNELPVLICILAYPAVLLTGKQPAPVIAGLRFGVPSGAGYRKGKEPVYLNILPVLIYADTTHPMPSAPRLIETSKKLRIPSGEQIKHPFCSRRKTIPERILPADSRSSV